MSVLICVTQVYSLPRDAIRSPEALPRHGPAAPQYRSDLLVPAISGLRCRISANLPRDQLAPFRSGGLDPQCTHH